MSTNIFFFFLWLPYGGRLPKPGLTLEPALIGYLGLVVCGGYLKLKMINCTRLTGGS